MNPTEQITTAIKSAGVERGDVLLVHAGLSGIMDLVDFESYDDAAELLLNCLLSAIGWRGTLVVPTFNYDFCKGKPYDHDNTPSQVGPFTNYVLESDWSGRTFHPIFPFAYIPVYRHDRMQVNDLFTGLPRNSFGPGSVFHRLHALDARILFIGASFESCTFVHCAERGMEVPYRFLKTFKGCVSIGGLPWFDGCQMFVKVDESIPHYFGRLEQALRDGGKMGTAPLGDGEVLAVKCSDVFDGAVVGLERDPDFLIGRAE